MNQDFLQQFRQQLAAWIEEYLATQRLPFQRLELCPRVLTEDGRITPDIVLWINRDSQLAGSMILLPAVVNDNILREGAVTSRALGLGHFTTWAAREVCVWQNTLPCPQVIQSYSLPPANLVQPEDFKVTLESLLEELKVVTITTAPAKTDHSLYYFANLCLRTLQDLAPGLTKSARLTAGETAADKWVELAPLEKSWMSLWRILFLLWQKRLPPGLQPDRLEQVFHYAMADYDGDDELKRHLTLYQHEPPLAESDAVRLHHLAGRMSQLGWPENTASAVALSGLLLSELAHRFQLTPPQIPWETKESTLWVNTRNPDPATTCTIVAPRAYLAGQALTALLSGNQSLVLAESLQTLSTEDRFDLAVATLLDEQSPDRKSREARLLLLRKAWPNRRFDLSHKSPSWLLDAIYMAGIVNEKLTIILPQEWYLAPGADVLWEVLRVSYQLTDISALQDDCQCLLFSRTSDIPSSTRVHREGFQFEVAPDCLSKSLTTLRFWLKADQKTIDYLLEKSLAPADMHWSEATRWGAYLYLNTHFGKYVWELCTGLTEIPKLEDVQNEIQQHGILIPDEMALQDLSLSGSQIDRDIPSESVLEQEFTGIWGTCPTLPERNIKTKQTGPRSHRKSKIVFDGIIKEVFIDGIPRFPEYYLMDIYKPELIKYKLEGPLKYAEEFFDKISLRAINGSQCLEVSGKMVAEALVLASWTGQELVELPEDTVILEKILVKYRNDLAALWDTLTRECRRIEPQRQAALRIAKRIWQRQGLPPENLF